MMRQRLSRFKSEDSDVESPVLRVGAGRTFNDLLPSSLHSKRPSRNGLAVAVQLYLLIAAWAEDWKLMSGWPGATLVLLGIATVVVSAQWWLQHALHLTEAVLMSCRWLLPVLSAFEVSQVER